MIVKGKKVGVISLGCDKNRVDTEKMLAIVKKRHIITADIKDAEIIIVNTCAFLEESRKESLKEIFSAQQMRKGGKLEKLIVTGCLPQKFIDEIYNDLTEADAFLGVSDYDKILSVIDQIYLDKRVNAVGNADKECGTDRVLTTKGYAYLKIADGCSNHCTYCLIPKIRGKYRSIPKADLLREIKNIGKVKELILVAQDLTKYGLDLEPKTDLVELLRDITALSEVEKVRLLYCYPENVTDKLIHEIRDNKKIIKYIDIPLQHADNKILKLMNRKGTGEEYLELIEKLKREISGIAVRSTFIAGFPSETEEEFDSLVAFIKKAKLFNAGFFKYSKEDGTAAARLPNQIDQKTKTFRVKKLYAEQKKVVFGLLKEMIGQSVEVLAEGFDEEVLAYYGRAYFNAPDIDGKVYFLSAKPVKLNEYYSVVIKDCANYDLYGERV